MTEKEIKQQLEQVADLRARRESLALQKENLRDSVLTDEIRAKLAEIDAEFNPQLEALDEAAAELEADVKQAIIALGTSVKGQHAQGVWYRGRVSWDTKSLEQYAGTHPELLQFRKAGAPYVVLRLLKP
ncbi:MAG: hypothetical protein HZB53_18135 [Chloroflexi bacterium]|nr:hypothetical protein [Chloroflexota bacterium]